MLTFMYVVTGAAAAGMILGLIKYRQGVDWGRTLVIAGLAVFVPAGIYTAVRQFWGPSLDGGSVAERTRGYTRVSTEKLGRYLAETFPGSKALVIEPLPHPYSPLCASTRTQIDLALDGLREGFGDRVEVVSVVPPVLPPHVVEAAWDEDGVFTSDTMIAVDDWLDSHFFNQMIEREGAGCDLIVSLASAFPADYVQLSIYNQDPRPKLALWFPAEYRRAYAVREAIAEGEIDAVVTALPRRSAKGSVPGDLDEAFNQMFLLLTPATAEKITQKYAPRR